MYGCQAIGLPMVGTTSGLRDAGRVLRITGRPGEAADGIVTIVAGAIAKATGPLVPSIRTLAEATPMATTKTRTTAITTATKRVTIS
jgi:hypothetical protein